jgi:uncharacterized membrane protein required for colicin V production
MNIIDIIVVGVLAVSSFIGMYYGFTVSVLSIASFFISWIGSMIFYPSLSRFITTKFPDIIDKLILYTDGASKTTMDDRSLSIASLSGEKVNDLVVRAGLPAPFDRILESNLVNHSFGEINIGQYFDYTIANIIINLISFIIIFLAIRLIFMVAISIANGITRLPVLKQFDTLAGAGFGFLRGFLILFVIFSVVPILLTLAPVDILTKYIEESAFAHFFTNSNFFTAFIRGVI